MKTCFKCHSIKPLSEFYKHPQMGDGHLNKCKECARRDTADRVKRLSSDVNWTEAELERHRLKSQRYRSQGRAKPTTTDYRRKVNDAYRKKHPDAKRAHSIVARAIRRGLLARCPCEVCGNKKSEGHHEDYGKPLQVRWLCRKHHAEAEVELRRMRRRLAIAA